MGLTLSGVRRIFQKRGEGRVYEKIATDDVAETDVVVVTVSEDEVWVDDVGRSSLQSPVPSKGLKRCAKSAESA